MGRKIILLCLLGITSALPDRFDWRVLIIEKYNTCIIPIPHHLTSTDNYFDIIFNPKFYVGDNLVTVDGFRFHQKEFYSMKSSDNVRQRLITVKITFFYKNNNYECYLYKNNSINTEPPQTVLVNNMKLEPTGAPGEIKYVSYIYSDNDEVDIFCFQKTEFDNCTLELEDVKGNLEDVSTSSVGVRTHMILKHKHHLSQLYCIRKCNGDKHILVILFSEDTNLSISEVNLEINSRPARQINKQLFKETSLNKYFTYIFDQNEPISLNCSSPSLRRATCENTCGVENNCNIELVTAHLPCTFKCSTNIWVNITYENFGFGATYTGANIAIIVTSVVFAAMFTAVISFVVYRKWKPRTVEHEYDYPVFARDPMPLPTVSTSSSSSATKISNECIYSYAVPHYRCESAVTKL